MLSSIVCSWAAVGRSKSTTVISFSSSGGILSTGPSRMTVLLECSQAEGDLAQPAHDVGILEEGVKVAQHPEAGLVVLEDRLEQRQGVALGAVLAVGQGRVDEADRAAPEQDALALFGGKGDDFVDRAAFLGRHQPDERVAGTDIEVEELFYGHRFSANTENTDRSATCPVGGRRSRRGWWPSPGRSPRAARSGAFRCGGRGRGR